MIQRDWWGNAARVGCFDHIFPSTNSAPLGATCAPFTSINEFIVALSDCWQLLGENKVSETISDELLFHHINNYQLVTRQGYHYVFDKRSLHRLVMQAYEFCERDERHNKYEVKKCEVFNPYAAAMYKQRAEARNIQKFNIKKAFSHLFA